MIHYLSFSAVRLILGFLCIWSSYLLLDTIVEFSANWSLTTLAIAGSLAAELIYQLYRYERAVVTPRCGIILLALRWTALAGLLWMLAQPVWSRMVQREILQEVVVLLDDSASMHLIDDGNSKTRQELAQQALDQSKIMDKLDGKVRVRTLRAARKVLNEGEESIEGWNQATDIAGALDTVLEQVPSDELAGVILVSDGRHNRPSQVEDVARRFGILDAPIGVLAVGHEAPPRDAAILSVQSPDAVYLGDRIRIATQLKFDGYRGKKAQLRLMQDDNLIEEREIPIPQDHHREEIRFRHTPDQQGITSYRIELEPLENERFPNNNRWSFETAVTDARTNVLIVESHPRWEFRYLRNLFYGRDKSIHLQYVLTHPDRISGQIDQDTAASASRPFGEAQATKLPVSDEEWRKFDVIILGDLKPQSLTSQQWKTLQQCVVERGTLLVTIAGPRWMPHAHQNPILEQLLPIHYHQSERTYFNLGQAPFKMSLTSAGQQHTVTAQSDSRLENNRIWSQFPSLYWRHPITGVKPGADVLLMAESSANQQKNRQANPKSMQALNDAIDALKRKKQVEQENALLVTQHVGKGKVATLLSDRSWRLREGVGDTNHHRFWGQLIRWGAGPNLRSGTAEVRLGTDQLTYSGDDPIEIMVRLRDEKFNPIQDPGLKAHIWKEGKKVTSLPLQYVEASNGLHRALARPLSETGSYSITLEGEKVDPSLTGHSLQAVRASIRVIGSTSPVELSETTLNLPLLNSLAKLSGGQVTTPATVGTLPALFLTGDESRDELRETTLWDHWLLLVILFLVLTLEWSTRRHAGLP